MLDWLATARTEQRRHLGHDEPAGRNTLVYRDSLCIAVVVLFLIGGAAAAATASVAAMTATTNLAAADDRVPEVGCQTAASATIGVTVIMSTSRRGNAP